MCQSLDVVVLVLCELYELIGFHHNKLLESLSLIVSCFDFMDGLKFVFLIGNGQIFDFLVFF